MLYESDEEGEIDGTAERDYYRITAKEFQMKLKKFLQN